MDQGLFKKHILTIQSLQDTQEEICFYIKEKTGIELQKGEISIIKKTVTLQTSSVKRSHLLRKDLKNLLQEKGYKLA